MYSREDKKLETPLVTNKTPQVLISFFLTSDVRVMNRVRVLSPNRDSVYDTEDEARGIIQMVEVKVLAQVLRLIAFFNQALVRKPAVTALKHNIALQYGKCF